MPLDTIVIYYHLPDYTSKQIVSVCGNPTVSSFVKQSLKTAQGVFQVAPATVKSTRES